MTDAAPADDLYQRFVAHIVLGLRGVWGVDQQTDDTLLLRTPGKLVLCLRHLETRPPEFAATLKSDLKRLSQLGMIEVVVIGGERDATKQLAKAARPLFSSSAIIFYWVGETGTWRSTLSSMVGSLVRDAVALADKQALPPVDHAAMRAALEAQGQAAAADAIEVDAFTAAMNARRPWATFTLIGIIAVVFALESIFGDSAATLTLLRFGALDKRAVLDGEWWRLLSCTFLHAGPLHWLLNSFVLFALGSSLERILGSARFLILYWLAGVGGSIVSLALLGEAPSVGASGAVWGLLAAEGVLGVLPRGLIPASYAAKVKQVALTNLALNVANSFRPGVDWGAHAGGGLVGVVLMATGLLVMGLKKLADTEGEVTKIPRSPLASGLAGLLFAVALGCLGMALVNGRPWAAGAPVELSTRPFFSTGEQVAIPRGLHGEKQTTPAAGWQQTQLGEFGRDPCVVFLGRGTIDASEQRMPMEQEVALVLAEMEKTKHDEGSTFVAAPARVPIDGVASGVFAKMKLKNGVLLEQLVRVRAADVVRVEVAYGAVAESECTGLAMKIASSVGATAK